MSELLKEEQQTAQEYKELANIGVMLRVFRKAAHLTQKEAAEKIGVCQSAISMWERGTHQPRMDSLPKIAAIYGCNVSDFFLGI